MINEHDLEGFLSRLKPTGAPTELGDRVRAKLVEESTTVSKPLVLKWEYLENFSIAALLFLAVGLWIVTTQSQERRLAALLGPTSAERRAEETIRSFDQIADIRELRALQNQLVMLIELASRSHGVSPRVHSLSSESMSDDWST